MKKAHRQALAAARSLPGPRDRWPVRQGVPQVTPRPPAGEALPFAAWCARYGEDPLAQTDAPGTEKGYLQRMRLGGPWGNIAYKSRRHRRNAWGATMPSASLRALAGRLRRLYERARVWREKRTPGAWACLRAAVRGIASPWRGRAVALLPLTPGERARLLGPRHGGRRRTAGAPPP